MPPVQAPTVPARLISSAHRVVPGSGTLHGHFCKLHRIRSSADRLLYVISTFSTRP